MSYITATIDTQDDGSYLLVKEMSNYEELKRWLDYRRQMSGERYRVTHVHIEPIKNPLRMRYGDQG